MIRLTALILTVLMFLTTTVKAAEPPELLVFTASWCPHCKVMKPIVAGIAKKGYKVTVVDADKNPVWLEQYKVTTIPTFIMLEERPNAVTGQPERAITGRKKDELREADLIAMFGAWKPAPKTPKAVFKD